MLCVGCQLSSQLVAIAPEPNFRSDMRPYPILLFTLTLLAPITAFAASASSEPAEKNYYVDAPGYGTQPESEPPRYVRTLSKTGIEQFKNLDWLDAGFESRTRYEWRNNDFRRNVSTLDEPILARQRLFMGVHDILDPFRVAFELQDSRRFNSQFTDDNRDVNRFEFIQAYGELYFKDALGASRPVALRVGRMAYEVMDRRLIARNEWRNTTNTFQGARALIGQNKNDWQLDAMLLQPLNRDPDNWDNPTKRQWFYGGIGSWRRWSEIVTIQPFYLGLHQDRYGSTAERVIHSPGIRFYGIPGKSGFDYDVQAVYQFGRNGSEKQNAFASILEVGYRIEHEWKPRVSVNYGYASGDRKPNDDTNERFEKFFGFARPWSNGDYFQWENIHAPKLRLEAMPASKIRFDTGINGYWLASDTDRWNNANLRDTTGRSGSFIGSEIDARVRYRVVPQVDLNVGYTFFQPGKFTQNTSRDDSSNFFYTELTFRIFE